MYSGWVGLDLVGLHNYVNFMINFITVAHPLFVEFSVAKDKAVVSNWPKSLYKELLL